MHEHHTQDFRKFSLITRIMDWDQFVLLALKFCRLTAYGQTAIVLVSFLASIGWSDESIGVFMSVTLFGDVVLSIAVGAISHKNILSRRTLLLIASVMLFFSGIVFATCSNYWILLGAAIIGVISPSGDEVGPFMSLESALMAHITPYNSRAYLFGIQGMLGTFGLALGMATGGWLEEHGDNLFGNSVSGYRLIFWLYSGWAIITIILVATLSAKCELEDSSDEEPTEGNNVRSSSADSSSTQEAAIPLMSDAPLDQDDEANSSLEDASEQDPNLTKQEERLKARGAKQQSLSAVLCLIFGLDSLAYGFMPNSWLVEYMKRKFGASSTLVGGFMFVSQFISALTSIPSVYLTNKIGPVLAIAFTKFGAGTFGAIVPVLNYTAWSMGCIILRSLFDTMDVVPRQLFLTSVVPKEQTVAVLSLVNTVKTFARSIAPVATGVLAANDLLWIAFVIMGGLEWAFGAAVIGLFH